MDPSREREDVLATLRTAVTRLSGTMSAGLIPEEGLAFGFAIRGARDSGGIASVLGGIRKLGRAIDTSGSIEFGNDDSASRAILTAIKFDPVMRSAAVMQYSDHILSVLENDLFLECASFAATARGKGGISTMDWGIAFCCREGVPDVIYEKRPDMDNSRLVLFGEDASDVANNIIICSNRL